MGWRFLHLYHLNFIDSKTSLIIARALIVLNSAEERQLQATVKRNEHLYRGVHTSVEFDIITCL